MIAPNTNFVCTINPGDPMQVSVPACGAETTFEVTAKFTSTAGRIRLVFAAPRKVKFNRPVNHRAPRVVDEDERWTGDHNTRRTEDAL